jgi:hypothetical protein
MDNGVVICRSSVNVQFGEETGAGRSGSGPRVMH